MNNKKLFDWSDTKIYLIIIGTMDIIIALYQPVVGFIGALILAYLIFYNIRNQNEKNKELTKYIERMSNEFDSATKHAIFNMPFPLVILDKDGSVTWYNTSFVDMIVDENIMNRNISDLVPNIELDELIDIEKNSYKEINYLEKYYNVFANYVETSNKSSKNKLIMLYWVETTDYVNLKTTYKDEKTIIGVIYVDNYDDVKESTSDINRPMVLAEIDKNINSYFSQYGGIVRKYENDKYLIVTDYGAYEIYKSKKFDILDQMRELDIGNSIPITLSIGLCAIGNDPLSSYDNARAAIDIALGRGGDQAVIKTESKFEFYGGKTKAVEKRNKVKARVIGYALRQLIDQADDVFVMGHKNPDMDSIGSSIGLLRAIKNRDKMGYIVLNGENPSIKNLFNRMRSEQKSMMDNIITSEQASQLMDKNSLMLVVDNHKPSFTEAPELLELTDKVVVIDHHRRGAEFIKDPVLTYLEPYSSSTSELVTEVLSYMSDKINMTKFEAEALLAGITVDTQNFTFQTGVRTFEAASILRREGADTTVVNQLFRDDISTFINKAEVIRTAKLVHNHIAIGRLEVEMDDSMLVAAQAANELLNINDVEASFVLTNVRGSKVHISGRSIGNMSVQLILEKLGGGGHLTSAGVQLSMSIDEAEKMLYEVLDQYIKEGEQ